MTKRSLKYNELESHLLDLLNDHLVFRRCRSCLAHDVIALREECVYYNSPLSWRVCSSACTVMNMFHLSSILDFWMTPVARSARTVLMFVILD